MDAPILLFASRTVMFAVFGGDQGTEGDAEAAEGGVINIDAQRRRATEQQMQTGRATRRPLK